MERLLCKPTQAIQHFKKLTKHSRINCFGQTIKNLHTRNCKHNFQQKVITNVLFKSTKKHGRTIHLTTYPLLCSRQIEQRHLKTGLLLYRQFHLSARRNAFPPLVWVVVSFVSKVTAVLTGRRFRGWLKKQPAHVRKRTRLTYLGVLAGFVMMCIYYWISHLVEAPFTGRKRFIIVTKEQAMKVAQFESENYLNQYKDQILPATHPLYSNIVQVAMGIVSANQDFPGMKEQNWTIHVVDDKVKNAFVLPNGHIFVFTGLVEFSENVHQFAVALGHEMAHALLSHGAEQLSTSQLMDYIVIGVMAFIWCFMPNDGVAAVANWFYHKVMDVTVHLPYSRELEAEADTVGLHLAAKACFDIRESSVLWKRMGIADDVTGEPRGLEWLSTHPSYETRVKQLDKLIPKAIEEREKCHCPSLPVIDPRRRAEHLRKMADNVMVHRATKSKLERVQAKKPPLHSIPTYKAPMPVPAAAANSPSAAS